MKCITHLFFVFVVGIASNVKAQTNALFFDGINDRAHLDTIWTSYNFTLEAKVTIPVNIESVLPTILSSKQEYNWNDKVSWSFHNSTYPGAEGEYHFLRVKSKTYYYFVPASSTGPKIADNNCHMIGVSRNTSGVVNFFIDGVLYPAVQQGLFTGTINLNGEYDGYIGYCPFYEQSGIDSYFYGTISEVRIWYSARSQEQIQATLNGLPSPLPYGMEYYNFSSGTGQDLLRTKYYSIQNDNGQYIYEVGDQNGGTLGKEDLVNNDDPVRTNHNCSNSLKVDLESNQSHSNQIELYPNPVIDWAHISVNDFVTKAKTADYVENLINGKLSNLKEDINSYSEDKVFVEIFDLAGSKVLNEALEVKGAYDIDLSNVKSGTYLMKLNYKSQIQSIQFIKR